MSELPEHVSRNRSHWDAQAADYEAAGLRNWESEEPSWGIWNVPEPQVGMMPAELEGRDAIELGWGAGGGRGGRGGTVPEPQVGMLPAELEGRDAIELGCGTAYVSAWLARRGARPVGIDNSAAQLETARRLQREHGLEFPLLHGNAESVPYPDQSFDLAISEYGAC